MNKILLIALLFVGTSLSAQTYLNFNVSQAPVLTSIPGADAEICQGDTTMIGGATVATGGTAPYTYSWSPTTGLSDATSSNPMAYPSLTTMYVLTVTDSTNCTVMDSVTVTVDTCLGFNESDLVGLEMYPNPSSGLLNVELEAPASLKDLRIVISNLQGQKVFEQRWDSPVLRFERQLDLQALASGTYILHFVWRNGAIARKIVVDANR